MQQGEVRTIQREISASINFRESPTNTPGKKFRDFYFCDKVATSDHTSYKFPRGNVEHNVYFQRRNDSKISTLIKLACRSLSAKSCHTKGRELTPRIYSQLRRVDCRSRKISALSLLEASTTKQVSFLSIYWICGSKALCSTRQQEIFGEANFRGNKISRAGV